MDQKAIGVTHLNLSINLIGGTPYQSGALFSFEDNTDTVVIRVGVSFVSAEQACSNAESEVGDATFEEIVARSKALWQDKLRRIEIDVPNTPPNVTEMLYSSLYRSFLTPVSVAQVCTVRFLGSEKLLRIMQLERLKESSQILLLRISIRFTAGTFSPSLLPALSSFNLRSQLGYGKSIPFSVD